MLAFSFPFSKILPFFVKEAIRPLNHFSTRCFTPAHIINYFSGRGIAAEKLLERVHVSKAFIDKPDNWIQLTKFYKILTNCHRAVPSLSIYDWQKIALRLHDSQAANLFWGIIALTGTQTMFSMVPRFIKRISNYQHVKILSIGNGSVDLITWLEPEVAAISIGYSTQLSAGVLSAIPAAVGSPAAKAKVLYDHSLLNNIVTKMYRHYRLAYQLKADRVLIDGREYGRRVRLDEVEIDGKTALSNEYAIARPYNATLITQDLERGGVLLLRKGDIYDAPYSRIQLVWEPESIPAKSADNIYKRSRLARQTFYLLEEQIELAEQRFFESEKLRANEMHAALELKKAVRAMQIEIAERKKTEVLLKARERELNIQTASLQEANTALKVMLKKRDEDKKNFSEKVLSNIKELIKPYLSKLRATELTDTQKAYLEILESNLNELSSSLAQKLSYRYFNLTPSEIRVAILTKQGRTTLQIANLLNLSPRTIDAYRATIRRKLNIDRRKINLRTYLNSL